MCNMVCSSEEEIIILTMLCDEEEEEKPGNITGFRLTLKITELEIDQRKFNTQMSQNKCYELLDPTYNTKTQNFTDQYHLTKNVEKQTNRSC